MAGQFLKVAQVVLEILVPTAGAAPVLRITGTPPGGTVGVPYGCCFTATGGTPPYSFAVTAGSVPPGTTLDPSTGCITGTPTTAGTFCFTATVTDSLSATADAPRCITIVAGSVIIQLIGWKLYPIDDCGPMAPGQEIPDVDIAV